MRHFKFQLLLMQLPAAFALVFPCRHERKMLIVAARLPILRLHLLTEMTTATFPAFQGVLAHELAELDEIGYTTRLVQLGIELG